MQNTYRRFLVLSLALLTLTALLGALPAQAALQTYGTLLSYDFDTTAWPGAKKEAVGTVDKAGSTQPSAGLRAAHALSSGLLPVSIGETNLGKLTLAFSLSASAARPVTVRVESFNRAKKRTGGLETLVYPAAPNFYQRYALDLSAFKPSGTGKFVPNAPYVSFRFSVEGVPWQGATNPEVRLDNVQYALPAYYVSPAGSDMNAGRSEKTAFATPQKAMDAAQAGDIIVLMSGTYSGGQAPVVNFTRPGKPAAWIVLKNYPGQHPTLTSTGWNIVGIVKGSKEKPYSGPPLAYLEIRGLHVRGEGDVARQKYPDAMDKPDSRTNSNGIGLDSRFSAAVFHHIRIADNVVEYAPGGGIGGDADWMTVENNICRSNCWTTIYAPSGISISGPANFDATDNVYKRLIRNNICCHNQTYEMWEALHRYSDGNGIILDVNQGADPNQGKVTLTAANYLGRTLVQSNLCYDNGGSGIHTVTANRVDIINNTVYHNSASVHLEYSEMFTYGSSDVHFINNIMVAPVANVAEGELPEPVNKGGGKNTDVTFSHNIYFGGNIAPTLGEEDVIADPQFVSPSIDDKTANFHLKKRSPALGKGILMPFSPFLDLDSNPCGSAPAEGAYQQ